MKYDLVKEKSYLDLVRAVNSLILKGWIPQGGIMFSSDEFYLQAMINKA